MATCNFLKSLFFLKSDIAGKTWSWCTLLYYVSYSYSVPAKSLSAHERFKSSAKVRGEMKKMKPRIKSHKEMHIFVCKKTLQFGRKCGNTMFSQVWEIRHQIHFYKKFYNIWFDITEKFFGWNSGFALNRNSSNMFKLQKYISFTLDNSWYVFTLSISNILPSKEDSSFIFIFNLKNIVSQKCKQATRWQQV